MRNLTVMSDLDLITFFMHNLEELKYKISLETNTSFFFTPTGLKYITKRLQESINDAHGELALCIEIKNKSRINKLIIYLRELDRLNEILKNKFGINEIKYDLIFS